MGRFSTTVHIKNNADREGFIGSFCEVMKKRGFVPCGEGEAALSYLLVFGEGGWVTLANEEYKDTPQKAYDDSREMAAALKTSAFSVEVVDSDFALLKLSNPNGGEDEVVVGDGSGYGIEDAPKGDRKCWEPLLAEGGTWEQLSEIREKREVFVEDALWNAAPVLGIAPGYMTADHRELSENSGEDENIRGFFFKKADEKKKSMTLNAAFIKVFGEGLEPLGFKRLKKIKNPIFVRAVNGEILHFVTYRQVSSSKLHYKCIEVLGGVATLYRRNLDFSCFTDSGRLNTMEYFRRFNIDVDKSVMDSAIQFYYDLWGVSLEQAIKNPYYAGQSTDPKDLYNDAFRSSILDFHCKADDADEMLAGMKNAFNVAKGVTLPVLDKVTDLNACVEYFYCMSSWEIGLRPFDEFIANDSYSCSEALILIKAGYRGDGLKKEVERSQARTAQLMKEGYCGYTQKEFEDQCKRDNDYVLHQNALRDNFLDDPELNKRVMEELERCKAKNIELLKSYGISINEE